MKRYTEQQIKELAVAYMTARKNADTAYLNGFTAVLDLLELTPEELIELATEET